VAQGGRAKASAARPDRNWKTPDAADGCASRLPAFLPSCEHGGSQTLDFLTELYWMQCRSVGIREGLS
jgi:hypothetical protein